MELFNYIKDQLSLGMNSDQVKMICGVCKKEGHLAGECGDIHLVVNKK
jgi:hypothetical protein